MLHYLFRYSFLILLIIASCSKLPDESWKSMLPEQTIAVYEPVVSTPVSEILDSSLGSFLDDISSSALLLINNIENAYPAGILVQGISFYPNEADQLQLVWIIQNKDGLVNGLRTFFSQPLFVDEYSFLNINIIKINVGDRLFYVLEHQSVLFLSESSYAIEQIIRTGLKKINAATFTLSKNNEDTFWIHGLALDNWIKQFAAVKYYPNIDNGTRGLGMAPFTISTTAENEELSFSLSGKFPLVSDEKSNLVQALSTQNDNISLDLYIPIDASSFNIHFIKADNSSDTDLLSPLDSTLYNSTTLRNELKNLLAEELAIATFAPTGGVTGVGEHLFMRKLTDTRGFYSFLRNLEKEGLINSVNDTYYIRSPYFIDLLSTGLASFEAVYLGVTNEVVVISPRLGLTKRVKADRSRRRVIAYNQSYIDIRNEIKDPSSSLFYLESNSFDAFIQSYLAPNTSLGAFLSKFELLAGNTTLNATKDAVEVTLNGYTKKRSTLPFEENWIAPLDGARIVGEPILANIGGSSRDEVIVAHSKNGVTGIANDGTVYFSASTQNDLPIGSPIVYDWYGNGQPAIMVAAGKKIYAWNVNGNLLPKFPFELSEDITTPLSVEDIDRNGIPEVLVATADNSFHVLDGRGEPLRGWPINTSSSITQKPYFGKLNDNWNLFIAADNGFYAYDRLGRLSEGFPIFISASFSTEPTPFNDGIMLGASDGHLYRIGSDRQFLDTLNVLRNTVQDSVSENLFLSGLYVSNSSINAKPVFIKTPVKMDSSSVSNENLMFVQSGDGSVQGFNDLGELRFITNMGQPSSNTSGLFVDDLEKDKKPEVFALAGFGRLYAWQILDNTRFFDIPTSGMEYPILTDLENDGFYELIAQTRRGLRCWTIYPRNNE